MSNIADGEHHGRVAGEVYWRQAIGDAFGKEDGVAAVVGDRSRRKQWPVGRLAMFVSKRGFVALPADRVLKFGIAVARREWIAYDLPTFKNRDSNARILLDHDTLSLCDFHRVSILALALSLAGHGNGLRTSQSCDDARSLS